MAPKNPPIREEQIVWLRHRKRGRLPHLSVRPVRLVRCRTSRSARFHPACRISADCVGHNSDKSPIRRDHPVVSGSSKSLSSQPTSVGRHLLWEIIGTAASAQGYGAPGSSAFDVRCWMFGVGRLLLEKSKIMITRHEHESDGWFLCLKLWRLSSVL